MITSRSPEVSVLRRWQVEPFTDGVWRVGDGQHHLKKRFFTPESAQLNAAQLETR